MMGAAVRAFTGRSTAADISRVHTVKGNREFRITDLDVFAVIAVLDVLAYLIVLAVWVFISTHAIAWL